MDNKVCTLTSQVIEISKLAGEKILNVYATDFDVEHKDDRSPLTAADMAAHDVIENGLGELTPTIPVFTEESAKIPFEERSKWNRYWLVDPLDGTREFVKRNGEFTVNIALIDNHKPVLGVVYVPVTGICYYGCAGQGAFKMANGKSPDRIQTRKWKEGRTVVAGSRSHRGDSLEAFLANLGDYEILSMGSSLKTCLVAEGAADVYPRLGPTSEWDTAAAQCIIEEAGGCLTDTKMQPLRYNTKESLLNPHFFAYGDPTKDWSKYLE